MHFSSMGEIKPVVRFRLSGGLCQSDTLDYNGGLLLIGAIIRFGRITKTWYIFRLSWVLQRA